jgi:hypothetical protein
MIIKLNIDVTKIDKARLHKGAKGTYANFTVLLRDETDQYGNDGMIIEDVTKEERESGKKGTILGNAKIIGKPQAQQQSKPAAKDDKWTDDATDDIPF